MQSEHVISAESDASVKLFDKRLERKLFVSVNGSDDEINAYDKGIGNQFNREREDIAIAVGTYYHKCVGDVYRIFCHLRKINPSLRLIIVGLREYIQNNVLEDPGVETKGEIIQPEVCNLLLRSKYRSFLQSR